MQYRDFGKTGEKRSALGFGCMRFPTNGDGAVDEAEATRMLRYAIDGGVNYVDTAYGYHGGESERVVGRALRDGYREKVWVATKMPVWQVKTYEDFDRIFADQLEKLQVDCVDCYLLHGLGMARWPAVQDLGALEWGEKMRSDGKIRFFGFSFHDDTKAFKQIVDSHDRWDFCQVQYNYIDVNNQAGLEGVQYAASKGLAVISMEPLLGGKLAGSPPAAVQAVWDEAPGSRTPADWALQWLWNQSEISLLLSGMSTFEQVEQNLASADASRVGLLSDDDLARIDRVRDAYKGLAPVPCTSCQYCMPCPSGVKIPQIFQIYNNSVAYNSPGEGRTRYGRLPADGRADQCVACGKCEELCPQGIAVAEWMEKIHAELSEA